MKTLSVGFMTAPNLRRLLVIGLLVGNLVFLTMGILAAALGGGLSDWGTGAGGLDGWADSRRPSSP